MRYLIALLLLSACSFGNIEKDGAGKAVADLARSRLSSASEQTAKPPQLTRAMLATQKKPLIRVRFPERGFETLAVETDRDGAVTTYLAAGGQSFSYKNGILVATRGLGADAMAIISSGLNSGNGIRSVRVLDGENQLIEIMSDCVVKRHGADDQVIVGRRHQTSRISERCVGESGIYTNIYWINPRTGQTWRSRQWVNPSLGYLETDVLVAR